MDAQPAPQSLSTIIETCRPEDRPHLARVLLAQCRRPGRYGVCAVNHWLLATPPAGIPETLRAIWAAGVSQPAWALAIGLQWIGGSHTVMQAAGNIGTLREWLRRADLMRPLAFMASKFHAAADLPPRIKVYRGGSTARAFLKDGLSWTPNRTTAAHYALKRQMEHGGAAVIVCTKVTPDMLALATNTVESEYVTLDARASWPDTTDPATIAALACKHRSRWEAGAARDVISLQLDDEAGWRGWTGDD